MEDQEFYWKNKRILVVDDFEMVRAMVSKAMRKLQCESIDQAENGKEAFEKIIEQIERGEPYDLIFSDWVMPILDGIGLFKKIRENQSSKNLPFVLFTVEADQASVMLAAKVGINHFMVKPVLLPKLVEKLKEIEAEIALGEKKRKFNV